MGIQHVATLGYGFIIDVYSSDEELEPEILAALGYYGEPNHYGYDLNAIMQELGYANTNLNWFGNSWSGETNGFTVFVTRSRQELDGALSYAPFDVASLTAEEMSEIYDLHDKFDKAFKVSAVDSQAVQSVL